MKSPVADFEKFYTNFCNVHRLRSRMDVRSATVGLHVALDISVVDINLI